MELSGRFLQRACAELPPHPPWGQGSPGTGALGAQGSLPPQLRRPEGRPPGRRWAESLRSCWRAARVPGDRRGLGETGDQAGTGKGGARAQPGTSRLVTIVQLSSREISAHHHSRFLFESRSGLGEPGHAPGLKVSPRKGRRLSSVQSLSRVRLFATQRTAACQASLSIVTPGIHPNSCPLSR